MLHLVQARNHCSNHCCCGLRNNASDVRRWQAHKLDPCSCVSRDVPCRLVLVCVSAVGKNREILKILKILKTQQFLEKKDPLHPLPSVHVAEERVLASPVPRPQPMSDASRLWSFGGRPSDILNFLGHDNPDFSKDLAYVHALWAICQLHGTASGSSEGFA